MDYSLHRTVQSVDRAQWTMIISLEDDEETRHCPSGDRVTTMRLSREAEEDDERSVIDRVRGLR